MSNLATSVAETGTRREIDFALLKRAQQIESSTAAQLIEGLKAVPTVQNLPANLGNTINTTA